jgi:hypothetical protein
MTMQGQKRNTGGIVGFVDDLNGAIRENPVAAGLVGMGVLWMFFGSARLSAFGSALPGTTRNVTSVIGAAAEGAGDAVSHALVGTVARVSDGARQVAAAISSNAGSTATTVLDQASAGYNALKAPGEPASKTIDPVAKDTGQSPTEFGRHIGTSMQQNLTKTLEAQPLLLGVMGIAIGAGIASAFPSTKMEQDMLGAAGAAVKEKIQAIASDTSERAKDVLIEVKKEAAVQGLTPASAAASLQGVVQKVKTAAASSQESIKDRFS